MGLGTLRALRCSSNVATHCLSRGPRDNRHVTGYAKLDVEYLIQLNSSQAAMESNRRIRPRNEQLQGGSATSRKVVVEKEPLLLPSAHKNPNATVTTASKPDDESQTQQRLSQEDSDAELMLMVSSVLGQGDKEAQFLYEKCGDSALSLQRYYRFLQDDKQQTSSNGMQESESQQDNLTTNSMNYLPHEKHNLALLQFLQSQQNDVESHLKHTLEQWTQAHTDNVSTTIQEPQDTYLCEPLLKKLQSLIAGYNLGILTLCQDQDPKHATILLASYFLSFEHDMDHNLEVLPWKQNPDLVVQEDEKIEHAMLFNATRNVMGHISFALLDSILTWVSVSKGYYQKQTESFYLNQETITTSSLAHRVLTWLDGYVKGFTGVEEAGIPHGFQDSMAECKFRLMCYKARLWFVLGSTTLNVDPLHPYSDLDEVTRQARKELKNAMEIFHHKLESEGKVYGEWDHTPVDSFRGQIGGMMDNLSQEDDGGGESVNSFRVQNLETTRSGPTISLKYSSEFTSDYHEQQILALYSKYRMKKLQSQHQIALYLKAHLEFIKNNTKKSLKLCSEAINVNDRDGMEANGIDSEDTVQNGILKLCLQEGITQQDTSQKREFIHEPSLQKQKYEAAIYNNNLGLIHQASGKVHLALHYYAKALAELERMEQVPKMRTDGSIGFEPDLGVVNLLHLTTSQVLVNTAICAQQARNFVTGYECMARCVMASKVLFYNIPRFWLNMAESCIGIHAELSKSGKVMESHRADSVENLVDKGYTMPVNEDGSVVLLGSEDDIAFVKKYPLIRALFCLNTCIQLRINGVTGDDAKNEEDNNCIESARVSLAYVWLELNNPTAALKETEAVIQASNNEKDKMDRNGRLAIARAYAHEAARTLR